MTLRNKREIYQAALPHRAVAVYLYLHDRANKQGTCFPAIKRISIDLNLSTSTVKRAICDLEQGGYIEKENRYRTNGGKSSNEYQIL